MPDDRAMPEEIAGCLISAASADERRQLLRRQLGNLDLAVIEALKSRADAEVLHDAKLALRIAEIAVEAAACVDEPEAQPLALWARSNALLYLGRYRECLEGYERARAVYVQRGQSLEVARLRINEIAALRHLGEYDQALRAIDEAHRLLSDYRTTRYGATLEMNAGDLLYDRGDYEEALAAFERGQELFAGLGDAVQAARMDINRAVVLEGLDRFGEAEPLLQAAHEILRVHGMTQEMARTDLNLGVLFCRQARYQAALSCLEDARGGFATLENKLEIAIADLYRAYVYLALNLLSEALDLATRCGREFRLRGMSRQVALAAVIQGVAQMGLGNVQAAWRCLDYGRRTFARRRALTEVALIDLERAALRRLSGAPASAHRIARRAQKVLAGHGLTMRAAQAGLVCGWCELDLARPDKARSLARDVLAVADQLAASLLAYRAHHLLGRVAEAYGELESAYREYRSAVEAAEVLRGDLWIDEFRATFLDDKLIVYEDAVRLALDLKRLTEAFELAGRANAAAQTGIGLEELESAPDEAGQRLLDNLRALRRTWHWKHSQLEGHHDLRTENDPERSGSLEAALWADLQALEMEVSELNRRWQARYGQPRRSPTTVVTVDMAMERRQAASEVWVRYSVLRGRLGAFVACRDRIEWVANLGAVAEVEQLVASWRFGLESLKLYSPGFVSANLGPLCADAQAHLRRLYDLVLAPLAAAGSLSTGFACCQRLYISLCPALSGVPFAALYDGERYMVEQCQVVHLADGFLPTDSGRPSPAKLPETCSPVHIPAPLVIGYSDQGRLPFAVAEAQRVATVLEAGDHVHLLTETGATEAEFSRLIHGAGLIHLATHATFRADNPFFSWLRLDDVRLTVADLYSLRLSEHPLVVLSACETGLSGRRGGGLIGSGRAWMAAGAGALVTTLWKVNDLSTAAFMECFYQCLMTGQQRSAALRAAQLQALASLRHPLHWAGFVLIESRG